VVLGNGFFSIKSGGDFGEYALYDATQRKFLTAFIYDEIKDGGDSTFLVYYFFDYQFLDQNGKSITTKKFRQASPFENGKAKVSYEYSGAEFYIDRSGRRVD
jgi:hypothetical protein